MKKLFTFLAVVVLTASVLAQSPQKMSYQAVIRDASNVLVVNHAIGMRVSILQTSVNGTVKYQEIYNPNPQTNANGLVTIEIGGGIPISGTFAGLDWSVGPYYIKTETDPTGGTNYTITGTSQLLSVPYALNASYAQKTPLVGGTGIKISHDSIINITPVAPPVTITGTGAIKVTGTSPNYTVSSKSATFRWNVFSTYDQNNGWIFTTPTLTNGDPYMLAGVTPQAWSDGGAKAESIMSDKEVLRTFFINKAYAGKNAMVYNDTWTSYSSTNGKLVIVMFRILNSTASAINWTPAFYYSANAEWGEYASVALNGVAVWNSGTSGYTTSSGALPTMSIPANSISTVFVVSASGVVNTTRTCVLAFYNNCLQLPAGLEFVDDLDTATGGWGQ
jgi:hypothetical protein